MKKITILWTLGVIAALFLYKTYQNNDQIPIFLKKQHQNVSFYDDGEKLVAKLNAKNNLINNFKCDLKLTIQKDQINFPVKAELFYEKPKNLRLIVNSFFGKESDIGSNDQEFWFWGKRAKPSKLYFAKYQNLTKVNLKTPLHPVWIMDTISLNNIVLDNSLILKYGEYIAVLEEKISLNGQNVLYIILIDPKKDAIIGHYLYDKDGFLIISSEITEHYFIDNIAIPKKIETKWYEEKLGLTWEIKNPIINSNLNPNLWHKPNIKDKEELGLNFCCKKLIF